jgi:methionyl-tRNA formyltransferase
MMNDLRIVFMGTPEFAVASLSALIANDFNVVGVVTAPDKKAGRGRTIHKSPVKLFALDKNIPIFQPTNLKSESFIDTLKSLEVNLQVVVAFRMLPKVVWDLPKFGTFNLHASLLPLYRGAAPIHWALINGENKTGVTTFFIDEEIDTGRIILQKETSIAIDDTVGVLHNKLMEMGSDLVVETVKIIAGGTVTTHVQPEKAIKKAPKLFKETCKINWDRPTLEVYNKIRGLNPFPCAWSILSNGKLEHSVKIFDVNFELNAIDSKPGDISVRDKKIKVACLDGFIQIDSLQLAGKKKMDSNSLLNGYSFSENAKML